jgi:hypothetical protein
VHFQYIHIDILNLTVQPGRSGSDRSPTADPHQRRWIWLETEFLLNLADNLVESFSRTIVATYGNIEIPGMSVFPLRTTLKDY